MDHSFRLRLFAFCLAVSAARLCFLGSMRPASAEENSSAGRSVYQADPRHLWNRLHEALFVRVGPDGRAYGQDRIEPLLWPQTKHLLEGLSRDRVVDLLEEFLTQKGETLIEDPLKRAVLQRDLWLVFNWLEGSHSSFEEPSLTPEQVRASQQKLRRPLAAVIGRLALSPDQIERLPDNYAAAVASGEFAKSDDPARPDQPYLPPDLFATEGPWVCVGCPDGPVATQHLREDNGNTATNSTFLVFVRLPEGRAATLDYLKRLRDFDQPLLVLADEPRNRTDKYIPNPKLPQFPQGTEVALVRRALLIVAPHTLTPSALTESIQLRVYREIPDITAQTLNAALVGNTAAGRLAHSWQTFHEFRLSRSLLFAGKAGGLHAVAPDERDFKTGFGTHPWDEFERSLGSGQAFPQSSQRFTIKETCFACHSFPGVYSFNSFFNYRLSNMRDGHTRPAATLSEMSLSDINRAAITWKQDRPNWTALRGLLAE